MLAAALLLAGSSTLAAQPQSQERDAEFELAIHPGPLAEVLEQFGVQTGCPIMTELDMNKYTRLRGVFGRASVDQALRLMLMDTDLSYTWNEGTIIIHAKEVQPPHAYGGSYEVLVTGSRLTASDEPGPVRAYERETIERLGVTTLGELSRYFTQQPFSYGAGHLQTGAQFVQLRGLGVDSTLVLLNGRRVPPSAGSAALNAFDLNNLPLSAVDRIEVISDSASVAHGADAAGGVVNIVLKNDIEEPRIDLHYGRADGGGTQRRAAVSLGRTGERLRSTLVLDYYHTSVLMGEERDLWRNQDFRRFGGQDYRVSTTHAGNVYSVAGQPLPGLMSSRAAIPVGTTGALSPASFRETDGIINLGSSFNDRSIIPWSRRSSAYGFTDYRFRERTRFFAEVLAMSGELTALRASPSLSRQVVPASNPFNPFAEAVLVDYYFADMEPISSTHRSGQLRLVAGAQGGIGSWEWEVSGLHHHESGSSITRGELDPSGIIAAIYSDDPNTALNLFSDGPAGSAALLDSLTEPPRRLGFSFSSSLLSGFIKGPVFNVHERLAEILLGGEWRRDAAEFLEFGIPGKAYRNSGSVFAQITVPLLDELSLKLAARADSYDAATPTVNAQYELSWRPTATWLVRAAHGTSFRPPSLFESNLPMSRFVAPLSDPRRGGEVSEVDFIQGGNRNLRAVTARSSTAGVTVRPSELSGVRLSANYWRVAMANRIVAPSYAELLNQAGELTAHRVVREAPSDQDLLAGWAGRLHSIDSSLANYGSLETSGVDLEGSLSVQSSYGNLELRLSATWVDEYLLRDLNPAWPLDRVGIANVQGTVPQWRAVGTLTWTLEDSGVSTTTTFVPSLQDADVWIGPLDRRIGSRVIVDLQAWMDLDTMGVRLLDGMRVTLGARNVLDAPPEFANAGASFGYDISIDDLTGRFIYFRIGKRFTGL